ncbi:hypothetical protein RKE29_25080 [Streptomyces sp. B1866]|uniref:hypothetical protein n=1 Tax=Streptomyces sp. B1866 TaxID=3075431 RepID=UPI00288E46A2|nr:hypothetical protein [Streptomyces sp. B1866]MDT3399870.1 hypothetical protein [Streptomyces sp. B1866]
MPGALAAVPVAVSGRLRPGRRRPNGDDGRRLGGPDPAVRAEGQAGRAWMIHVDH